MLRLDAAEDSIPVRSPIVSWRTQSSDGIAFASNVADHDVVQLVVLDASGEVSVDLDVILQILLLNRSQKTCKPFERVVVATDPKEAITWFSAVIQQVIKRLTRP